jgi:hypothetical protein
LRYELGDRMHGHPRAAEQRIAAQDFRIADKKASGPGGDRAAM